MKRGCTFFSGRGWCNLLTLAVLVAGVITVLIVVPIIKSRDNRSGNSGIAEPTRALVDKDSPSNAMTFINPEGTKYNLVFSDEFESAGRSFLPGEDPFWEAKDMHYWPTQDHEYYKPSQVSTGNGSLQLLMEKIKTGDLDYRSGMVQSWNKFCFRGGYLEANVQLPGNPKVSGFWPAIWTLGNLARAGYGATTEGTWPYSYDTCDTGVLPNQTIPTLSHLPGQRLSRCLCKGDDTPSPGQGRGAPELDLFEASVGRRGGEVSQSHQMAPFDARYSVNADGVTIYNVSNTFINTYKGGVLQQAISGVTGVPDRGYETGGGFVKYGVEYVPGPTGWVRWYVDGVAVWKMDALAVGPNALSGVAQRLIADEPMSIVMNFGMSDSFSPVRKDDLPFPSIMSIDYIRLYQEPGKEDTTCNPKDRPTRDYIQKHSRAYSVWNYTTWRGAGYEWPGYTIPSRCE
ncbi:MAG: family 16 glycoside hydrolase [Piptocephalis tieghemiana]|nr:MAG: family 16 glycoside hydrolase [Piptocephalis tieghemiana]